MQKGDRAVFLVWIELSAVLMIVGTYGAWVEVGPTGLAGTTAGARGWIVLAAALVAAGVAAFRRATRSAGAYVFALGVAAVVAAIYDRTHLAAIVGGGRIVSQAAGAGWGLYVALAASISLAIAGAVWVIAMAALPWAWLEPDASARR
ncbi:MAG TPA: hypothetical protein VFA24_02895 [Gaiellaceae bacterium]|nr:hypothetical protein [Gaiellaceae bacterium]